MSPSELDKAVRNGSTRRGSAAAAWIASTSANASPRGTLDEELARRSEMADHLAPGALVLLEDSFAATDEGRSRRSSTT